ncbi:hypothetical protein [Nocardioides sp.]|uniref:hypothetical protein n=1 Tax=Nocardioides sp. TaxID=35761 RepID=UPI0026058817|nr:hypothetical protein [Nocardioides sp.]
MVLPLIAAGCGGDQVSAYCGEVKARQQHLSELVAAGKKDALLQALPDFQALAAKAPSDIQDSWSTLIGALEDLKRATSSGDKAALSKAATALAGEGPTTALADIQQQVRDVCHTPLTV